MVQTSDRLQPVPFPEDAELGIGGTVTLAEMIRRARPPTLGERIQGIAVGLARGAAEVGIGTVLEAPSIVGQRIAGAIVGQENLPSTTRLGRAAGAAREALPEVPESVRREPGVAGFLTRDVPAGLGSTGAFLGAAAVGGPVASALAGAFSQGTEAYRESEGSPEEERWAAFLFNLPIGAADAISAEMILGRLAPSLARIDRRSGGAIGKIVATEGATEASQQALSNFVARDLANYDEEREIWEGVPEAALLGGTVGALFGGAVELAAKAKPGKPLTVGDLVEGAVAEQAAAQEIPSSTPNAGAAPALVDLGPSDRPRTAADLLGQPPAELPPVERSLAKPGEVVEGAVAPVEVQPGEPGATVSFEPSTGRSERPAPAKQPGSEEEAALVPEVPAPEEQKTTGPRNAVVADQLDKMGLPPVEHAKRATDAELHARAMEILKADPFAGKKLVDDLDATERPPFGIENALLALEANRLIVESEAAQEAFVADPTPENKARVDATGADYARFAAVDKRVGGQSSDSLRVRQMMVNRDNTLAAWKLATEVSKGEPLTPEESAHVAELNKLHRDQLAEVEKSKNAAEKRAAEAEAALALERLKRDVKGASRARARQTRVAKIDVEIETLVADLGRSFAGTARGGLALDPVVLAKAVKLAGLHIQKGAIQFAAFAEDMVKRLGENVRPYLEEAWKAAQAAHTSELVAPIAERMKEGEKLIDLRSYVLKIARNMTELGRGETHEALTEAVHAVLVKADATITKEQARDAVSGYGDFRPLSTDEVSRKLRDRQGEMRGVAKLEALAKRRAALKSGPERAKRTDLARRLDRQYADEAKRLGIKTADDATQLRSALDAKKRSLTNQISDLQHEIDTGTRIVKGERVPISDAEVAELTARRDELKAQREAIFAVPKFAVPKTPKAQAEIDAQRAKAAEAAIVRSLEDVGRQLEGGAAKARGEAPSSAKLDFLRKLQAALRAELDEFRELAKPAVDLAAQEAKSEAVARKAKLTRLANEEARTRQLITFEAFEPRTRPTVRAPTPEEVKAQANLETTRLQYKREKLRHEMRNRTRRRKLGDALKEVVKLPQAIWTMWDFSATLRQGAVLSGAHPLVTISKHVPRSIRATFSAEYAQRADAEVRAHPLFELARSAKLDITSYGDALGPHEEALRSALSDYIPGKKGSDRGFTTFLNMQRMDAFASMVRSLLVSETTARAKAIANYVNIASGRGNPGKLASGMELASYILWSPRLLLSRVQLLAGQPFYGGDRHTRNAIAKSLGRSLTALGAFYATAQLAATWIDDEEDKPKIGPDGRSSDFGKVIIGDVRIDPLAGLSQVAVLATRLVTGETKSIKGEVSPIRGDVPYGRDNAADVAFRFGRSKANPVAGMVLNLLAGENMIGEDVSPSARFEAVKASPTGAAIEAGPLALSDMYGLIRNQVAHRTGRPASTLTFADIYDSMRKDGVPHHAALGLLSIFGMGVQTYDERAPKPKKAQGQRSGS